MPAPLRSPLHLVLGATVAAACIVAVLTARSGDPGALLVFPVLAVVAEALGGRIYGTVSLSAVAVVAAAAAGQPLAAVVAALAAGVTTTAVARSRRVEQYLFNPAALVLCAGLCNALYGPIGSERLPVLAVAGVAAGAAYFLLDNLLVALVTGIDSGRRPGEVLRTDLAWLLPGFLAYGALGAVLAFGWRTAGLWGVVAFLVPPLLVRVGQRQYLRRSKDQLEQLTALADELAVGKADGVERHRQTAAALAGAIDARDAGTGGHLERVTVLGQTLLEAVAPQLAADPQVAFGFLLHDVGKIGVPDAVLGKAGDLTMDERAVMDTHPEVGVRIVEQAGFSPVVAELVLTHHERWDGTGYPGGLAGEEIPLAARLFSVVDALDAMTSDRPYRRALPLELAFAELDRHAGGQFDPAAVEALTGLGIERVRALLELPRVITLPDAVPHQAGSVGTWSSTPA